jgi:hypothetical protein
VLLQTIFSEASEPDAGDGQGAGDKKAERGQYPWASKHSVTGSKLHIAKIKDRSPSLVLREDSRQILCCVIDRLGALIYVIVAGIVRTGL